MKYLVMALIIIPLIVGFLYVWKKNHETPIPEDAFATPPDCGGCANKACGNYKAKH